MDKTVGNLMQIAFTVLTCVATASHAQKKTDDPAVAYPNKPVRIIVGNAPGGGTDTVARLMAQKLGERWGRSVVVENRAGATGIIAMQITAEAAPDGYSLLLGGSQLVISTVLKKLPFDIRKVYVPIVRLTTQPYVLAINASVPASSAKELVAYARSKPGALNYGSSGNGSLAHLGMDLFKTMAKIDMVHVPYKGGGPALTDLIGGQIQLLFGTAVSVAPNVRNGRLKVLAVTGSQRTQSLPDVPTISEAGLPGYELSNSYGLYAPIKTPQAIIQTINVESNKIIATPEFKARLAADDVEAASPNTPASYKSAVDRDFAKWETFFKTPGLALESYR